MPRQIADLAKEPAAQGTPVPGCRLRVGVLHVVPQLFVAAEHLGTVLAEKVHCLLYLKSAILFLVLSVKPFRNLFLLIRPLSDHF